MTTQHSMMINDYGDCVGKNGGLKIYIYIDRELII